jgi:chloramphenicol-sensitive protein RarD
MPRNSGKSHETTALLAGIAAFATWGLIPVYWKLLASIPAAETLAHRFVWTTIFLSIVLSWQRRWSEVVAYVRSSRARIYCLTGGIAIASNWFVFIWAVNIGRVIETSR